jgi:Fic family protein
MAPVHYHHGKFPPASLDLARLLPLIGPASAALARYEGLLLAIPNARVLIAPLTTQEAVLSSKIEGTQATMGEVLEFEASEDSATGAKLHDIQEVLNYRAAMLYALEAREKLPLSQRLLRETHEVLMSGVRGQNKTPGDYRRIPNWIGPEGCGVEQARFVPPGADQIPDLMTAWEKYLHQQVPDKLVQLAILHAEFEAIHPFLDGNGRLGRLLVPLFLVEKKLLASPNFYISAYFESHRDEYYERLRAVSADDDWTGWCEFFLIAMTAQAKDNENKARAILSLYQLKKEWIAQKTKSHHAILALDWFFNRPIFKVSDFIKGSTIPETTAKRVLRVVRDEGLLIELHPNSGRRSAVLVFPELLNIAEGKTVF